MTDAQTILLVEDEPDLREVIALDLRRRGYDVQLAGDVPEAERLVQQGPPELVVVDMMLPGASGFRVLQLVKERSEGRVPVIMMSGNNSHAHRAYALAAGADAFLAKPFGPEELAEAIAGLCPVTRPEPVAATGS